MKKSFIFGSIISLMVASACNKDDVIIGDEPTNGARPVTSTSSAFQSQVFEYTPAPGQFINDTGTGGFNADINTPEAACQFAFDRLKTRKFVSLGAWGGYIVVGFDHSIVFTGGYEFAIEGNAFDSSNEPGIVWVMQDTNANGLPDDTWYQLRGSEYGKEGVIENLSVTYYKPAEPGKPVPWTDSQGNSGEVDYLKAFHKQDFYYPAWIPGPSYTLTGTRLPARTEQGADGIWRNLPFAWGYADNLGSDCLGGDAVNGAGQMNGFKLSNAITADGKPANLKYIDFVKVQTGIMSQAGIIGENSTEVFSFIDLSLADL